MFFLYVTRTIKSDNKSDNKYSDNKIDIIRPISSNFINNEVNYKNYNTKCRYYFVTLLLTIFVFD